MNKDMKICSKCFCCYNSETEQTCPRCSKNDAQKREVPETLEQMTYRLMAEIDDVPVAQPSFDESVTDPNFKRCCKLVSLARLDATNKTMGIGEDKKTVVIAGRPINDVLAEVAFQIYAQTGIRIQHAEFNWMENPVQCNLNQMLRNVSVTSLGGPL